MNTTHETNTTDDNFTTTGTRIPTIFCHRDESGLRFYCRYCDVWHIHGVTADGPVGVSDRHRAAHCLVDDSPYLETGYVLQELPDPLPPPHHRVKPKYARDGRIVSGNRRKRDAGK
jgi:hypothetical protein